MRPIWRQLWPHREATLILIVSGGSALVALTFLLSGAGSTGGWRWAIAAAVVAAWLGGAAIINAAISRRYATMMTVIGAFCERDYSVRARLEGRSGGAGEVLNMLNSLGDVLREQRLGALESQHLVARVLSDSDVAVFVFDSETRLRIVNRAAEALLARLSSDVTGRTAEELGLSELLTLPAPCTLQPKFINGSGTWELHRSPFRTHGALHSLVMMTDVGRVLRAEERQVFNRLVRVLGHEINNSMAPITSVATQLLQAVREAARPADWERDLEKGLALIARRSESLNRFLSSYARVTGLPAPRMQVVDVGPWLARLVALQQGHEVRLEIGSAAQVMADPDQIDQLLINLIKNAIEASGNEAYPVIIGWTRMVNKVEIWVRDQGPGLANPTNLFVPFFTTKEHGSGIGLVLSRQIAEGHKGTLTLTNRTDCTGCEARLQLPLA